MTWADLFERADQYDVSTDAVTNALDARRNDN
ncbi:uncharacterized protein NP_4422A [Natronomonas pharaonis DSM 2160]|uniref:Uncharacterized protein n=1 Tax=Natronomonas pharaonis (strain ATCC 35678 / DSM 2160 / CIP 103997 / JCM 8858 / NBRC 14720 / NCIMB 2260 / Gabara) TaxID=348780 RepID=A0A1U7EYJ7_NATPD|nr:uncharacterized protein NP_4422A [Natronomonas pharaonis DSM 2160]